MKKIIFLLPVLLAVTFLSASAADAHHTDPRVEKLFNQQFAGALDVSWVTTKDGYLKASFVWGGRRTDAYFVNGEFAGAARVITIDQLPLRVSRGINDYYAQSVVVDIVEISTTESTLYSVVLEYKNRPYRVQVGDGGNIISSERIRK